MEGRLRFQPCGQADAQPVDDETGSEARRIIEDLGYGADRVHAAVVLDGARLVEIRTAAPEVRDCESILSDGLLEAHGNEPFWSVRIESDREARWITPEDLDGRGYFDGSWGRTDGGDLVWVGRRDGVDGVELLRVRIVEERCLDTMSGARFPFSATVEEGGTTYRGCALEGRRAFGTP
jgi:uncharacterized membrane protein